MSRPTLSIIVPTLNEAAGIASTLKALAPLRARGSQVVVADGGSHDGTDALAQLLVDRVLTVPRGRARQMNAGAAYATGDILLFLHADTRLPADADQVIQQAIQAGAVWGRFDVSIEGRPRMLRVVSMLMNLRSRWTGIATGDQAVFVRREIFERVGCFPDQALMEDVALSAQLLRVATPFCLRARAVTSGRRWETHGVWRTIFLMWRLRWRYWRGESPQVLAEAYR
jgi:rSAM/selenodomain-associated transferase 2